MSERTGYVDDMDDYAQSHSYWEQCIYCNRDVGFGAAGYYGRVPVADWDAGLYACAQCNLSLIHI